jgi:hypothetical protein
MNAAVAAFAVAVAAANAVVNAANAAAGPAGPMAAAAPMAVVGAFLAAADAANAVAAAAAANAANAAAAPAAPVGGIPAATGMRGALCSAQSRRHLVTNVVNGVRDQLQVAQANHEPVDMDEIVKPAAAKGYLRALRLKFAAKRVRHARWLGRYIHRIYGSHQELENERVIEKRYEQSYGC